MKKGITRLHFIEQAKNEKNRTELGSGLFLSGFWHFSMKTAEGYKGLKLLLHRSQTSPAHRGGVIVGVEESNYAGRVVFKVKADKSCEGQGTATSATGWARWMKLD